MLDIKKNHLGKRILSLAIMACMAVPGVTVVEDFCAPVIAEAGHRNADEERLSGQRMLEEHRQKHIVTKAEKGSYAYEVQKNLIDYNQDRLNFDDGKHERWLEPIYLKRDHVEANAWSNGGIVIMTSQEGALCAYRSPDEEYSEGFTRKLERDNLIVSSNFASVLAHEFAHFANKDTMLTGQSHKENIREELQADVDGMDMMAKVPQYSMGSMISIHLMERDYHPYPPSPDYPSNQEATEYCMKHLSKVAKGRVSLDNDMRMTVDGKLFMGDGWVHGGTKEEGNRRERTLYLAGQIASCINAGIWHKKNLVIYDASEALPSVKKGEKVLLFVGGNGVAKCLGTFDYPVSKDDNELSSYEEHERETLRYILDMIPE